MRQGLAPYHLGLPLSVTNLQQLKLKIPLLTNKLERCHVLAEQTFTGDRFFSTKINIYFLCMYAVEPKLPLVNKVTGLYIEEWQTFDKKWLQNNSGEYIFDSFWIWSSHSGQNSRVSRVTVFGGLPKEALLLPNSQLWTQINSEWRKWMHRPAPYQSQSLLCKWKWISSWLVWPGQGGSHLAISTRTRLDLIKQKVYEFNPFLLGNLLMETLVRYHLLYQISYQ